MDVVREALGEALSREQLAKSAASALFFFTLSRVGENIELHRKNADGTWTPLSLRERKNIAVSMCGGLHAIVATAVGFHVLASKDPAIYTHAYGRSQISQTLFAFSSGYFAWDLAMCLANRDVFGYDFLFHASTCLVTYVLGQRPFLNYYGAMFLMFEISTPFLHVRSFLLTTGRKDHPWFNFVQNCFGWSFLLVRILYGYPLSAYFLRDMIALYRADDVRSRFHFYFHVTANFCMCLLNAFWLRHMIRKRQGKTKKKGAKDD